MWETNLVLTVGLQNADRMKLFRAAAAAHINYASLAANAQGVDRHFFGTSDCVIIALAALIPDLRLLIGLKRLLQDGEKLPEIYNDPVFAESANWVLSTSQLSSEFFNTWGYAEVVDNGFGLGYSVNSDSLRFCIITKTGKDKELAHYLEEAAVEMREHCKPHFDCFAPCVLLTNHVLQWARD